MVLWKETPFPLWGSMERRWKRNVVSRVSSVIMVIRLPISCVSSTHAMYQLFLWQMGRRCVYWPIWSISLSCSARCLLGCCPWFSCCAANVRLSICVWYCHVPGHWLSSGQWQESGPIWAFVVIPHQVDWLFNCWYLSSLVRSPKDVIIIIIIIKKSYAQCSSRHGVVVVARRLSMSLYVCVQL